MEEEKSIIDDLTDEEIDKMLEELFREDDEDTASQAAEEDVCTEETWLDRIFDLPENHQIMEDGTILYGARY